MKLLSEIDQKTPNIEIKVGIFISVAIAGIIAVVAFIGIQQDVFSYKKKLYFIANSGKDICEGQTVTLSGFKIGKVKRLLFDDIARVNVELLINNKYMKWIKVDSKAKLIKELPMGNSVIEITPGSRNADHCKDNNIIAFESEASLTNLTDIAIKVNDLLDSVKETIIITNAMLEKLDKNTLNVLRKANIGLKSVRKNVPGILHKTNKSLDDIQKMAEDLQIVLKQTTPKIQSIMDKGNDIADGTKDVVDSVKKIWPIRSHIKETKNNER